MVIQRTKKKIQELHELPEEHRYRFANRYILIGGIILVLIGLFLLLPLQLILTRWRNPNLKPAPVVHPEASPLPTAIEGQNPFP